MTDEQIKEEIMRELDLGEEGLWKSSIEDIIELVREKEKLGANPHHILDAFIAGFGTAQAEYGC